jgi:peptide/nickel transport system permease protein
VVKFIGRRLAVGVVSLFVFSLVMFWLVESLIPGDYFSIFRLGMTEQEVEALREAYGVNLPIHIRWWRWLQGFFEGGLGQSTTGGSVSWDLSAAIAPTVFGFVTGLIIAYAFGQRLGLRWYGYRDGIPAPCLPRRASRDLPGSGALVPLTPRTRHSRIYQVIFGRTPRADIKN